MNKKNKEEVELEITYSPLSVAGKGGGDVFLLLPWVLLEEGAFVDGCGVAVLDLPIVGCLLERVQAKGGGEPSRTILPMGGRLPS